MPPGLTIPTIFTAINKFSTPISVMTNSLGAFANKAQIGLAKVEMGFRRVMAPIMGLQNMLRGVGIYIGLFTAIMLMKQAVGVLADFEQAQINISAVNKKSIVENRAMADQARRLALTYGQSAKSILEMDLALIKAGKTQRDVLEMSPAIATGAVALNAIPEDLFKTVNAVAGAYRNLPKNSGFGSTQDIVDLMAKAADLSTMDFTDIQTMIPRAVQSAALAGMDFRQLLALFAAARDAQVHVASGSVAIKNMLIQGAIHGKDFNEMLSKIIESPNAIKKAYKMFGSRTLVTALPLAEAKKLGSIESFLEKLNDGFKGYSQQVATIRLDSINGRLTLMRRSWEELILSIENGNGPVGSALKRYLDIGRAMLLIGADTDISRDALLAMDKSVIDTAKSWLKWIKLIAYATGILIAIKVVLVALNVAFAVGRAIMVAYNVVLGITAALTGANILAMRGWITSMVAFRYAVIATNAVMTALNFLFASTPIGWIALAAAGLLAIITHWNEWGAAIGVAVPGLTVVMGLFQNLNKILGAFRSGGILNGIKAIGRSIYEAFLIPLQVTYELLGKITGNQGYTNMAKIVEAHRKSLWANFNGNQTSYPDESEKKQPISKRDLASESFEQLMQFKFGKVGIEVSNKSDQNIKTSLRGNGLMLVQPDSTFDH